MDRHPRLSRMQSCARNAACLACKPSSCLRLTEVLRPKRGSIGLVGWILTSASGAGAAHPFWIDTPGSLACDLVLTMQSCLLIPCFLRAASLFSLCCFPAFLCCCFLVFFVLLPCFLRASLFPRFLHVVSPFSSCCFPASFVLLPAFFVMLPHFLRAVPRFHAVSPLPLCCFPAFMLLPCFHVRLVGGVSALHSNRLFISQL